MAYEPRGDVKTIIDHMGAQDASLEWTADELAEATGVTRKSVTTTLKTAVRHECLYAEKRGRSYVYSLTPFAQDPQEEVEPVEFGAALHLDGDLVIYGAQANEDGSFTVNAEQVERLKKFIAWSPAA
jgi:predicted transcriptional regulator